MAYSEKAYTTTTEHRKLIIQIVEKLLSVANTDYKKELTHTTSSDNRSNSLNKPYGTIEQPKPGKVLSNITNTYQNMNK
jgi:hypothetical protein